MQYNILYCSLGKIHCLINILICVNIVRGKKFSSVVYPMKTVPLLTKFMHTNT